MAARIDQNELRETVREGCGTAAGRANQPPSPRVRRTTAGDRKGSTARSALSSCLDDRLLQRSDLTAPNLVQACFSLQLTAKHVPPTKPATIPRFLHNRGLAFLYARRNATAALKGSEETPRAPAVTAPPARSSDPQHAQKRGGPFGPPRCVFDHSRDQNSR